MAKLTIVTKKSNGPKAPKQPKAAKGEARIFEREPKWTDEKGEHFSYGCTWTATLPDGSSKRIVLCAKTRELITAKRDAKMLELAKGEYVAHNATTFATWATQWLSYPRPPMKPM